ncbi:MAG: DMT family transporter [Mesorhizobium sp.]|nr:DMT family transporter [Mesorhizobium sp.]MBN9243646.1 DMT family transporter [Mesorhizobium sp.]
MTATTQPPPAAPLPAQSRRDERRGSLLVFLSALMWSFGGTFARYLGSLDSWTVVFWRSVWAAAFLVGFMIWRDGWRGTIALFRGMGLPGLAVAVCFATASATFVVALSYTTVANILLMQAGVPLLAAFLAWLLFRERVSAATWVAIAAVIAGVAIMVSESLDGTVSPIGNGLALLISTVVAVATVLTRRFAHVRMTPATCLGTLFAAAFAASQASAFAVSGRDMGFLFGFGVVNLGLGLAFFATGARMVPAAIAALLGTFEPLLGPIWVWLVHGEVPSVRTLIGGAVVFVALITHIALEARRLARPVRPGVTGIPAPN